MLKFMLSVLLGVPTATFGYLYISDRTVEITYCNESEFKHHMREYLWQIKKSDLSNKLKEREYKWGRQIRKEYHDSPNSGCIEINERIAMQNSDFGRKFKLIEPIDPEQVSQQ